MVEAQEEFCTTRNELPEELEQILSSVKGFQGEYEYERDYLKVLEKLKDTHPFSVLVFYESPENGNHIFAEVKKQNPHLSERRQTEIAEEIIFAERIKLNPCIPERILSGIAEYVQFYFVPELEEKRLGTYRGSGYCSTQSTCALALARLSETTDVPTHILILDRQNLIKHVLSSPTLIVQPHETSSQYVSKRDADEMLKNTIKAYGSWENRWEIDNKRLIESIYLERP